MIKKEAAGVLGVIPVRWGSTRLPGKPLADIGGIPMVVRVYRRAAAARCFGRLLVACDDRRILEICHRYDVPAEMTSARHRCGTERVREVALRYPFSRILNIQGDEPFVDPHGLEILAGMLPSDGQQPAAATLAAPLTEPAAYLNPSVVKVVCNSRGEACWFSRSPLPWSDNGPPPGALRHIGLYGYTAALLDRYPELPESQAERCERLEQLRFLEAGIPVRVGIVAETALSVDTPEDLEAARCFCRNTGA